MNGDWDDVKASVQVAAGRCEMAVVASHEVAGDHAMEFSLVTVGDEPASLKFEAGGDRDPRRIRAWARVGTFGDTVRERKLLGEVDSRLVQLRGRDWAPLDP